MALMMQLRCVDVAADEITCGTAAMQVGDWTLFLLLANVVCGSLYLAMLPPCVTRVERNPCCPKTGYVHKRPSDLIVFFLIWVRPRPLGRPSRDVIGVVAGHFCPYGSRLIE